MRRLIVLLAISLYSTFASAQTPIGLWQTIDDTSSRPKSLVRIVEDNGVLSGRIERLIDPDDPADPPCVECTDERRGKPIVGMTILRNLRKSGSEAYVWDGGDILDPKNGRVYQVRLSPIEGGRKLEVQGYIGMPLLGRTQTWIRME